MIVKNRIIYTSMMASISILLISVMILDAEAKTFDRESEIIFKGLGMSIFGRDSGGIPFNLQISPIDNSKELSVSYVNADGSIRGLNCHAAKQILKVSGTLKASAEFNTADLSNCAIKTGGDSMITVTLVGDGRVIVDDKDDFIECFEINGIDVCSRIHGKITNYLGVGTMTAFGSTFIDSNGLIRDLNVRTTFWTNP